MPLLFRKEEIKCIDQVSFGRLIHFLFREKSRPARREALEIALYHRMFAPNRYFLPWLT